MVYRQLLVGIIFNACLGWLLAGQQPVSSQMSMSGETEVTEDTADSEDNADAEDKADSGLSSYVLVEEDSQQFVPSISVVATKTPVPLKSTPFNVGVVTERTFTSQHAQVLGNALENVSGVVAHKGSGVFDYFVIRGFDSLSTGLVLIDGAPEPESTFYHLYNVDRVEVLKGPGAFLYGGNPLAGSVNLIRKEAVFEDSARPADRLVLLGRPGASLTSTRQTPKETLPFVSTLSEGGPTPTETPKKTGNPVSIRRPVSSWGSRAS